MVLRNLAGSGLGPVSCPDDSSASSPSFATFSSSCGFSWLDVFSYLFSPFYLPGLFLLHLKTPRLFPVPELPLPFLFHRQLLSFPSGSPWQQTVLSRMGPAPFSFVPVLLRLRGYLLPSCRFSFPIPLFPEQSLSRLHPAAPVPAFRRLFCRFRFLCRGFQLCRFRFKCGPFNSCCLWLWLGSGGTFC